MGNENMIRNTEFEITCERCGAVFKSKVSNAKRCKDCRAIVKMERFKTHRNVPMKLKPKTCERCKLLFNPSSTNVRYCDECKKELKKLSYMRKPFLTCPTCGDLYIKTGNHQKRCPFCRFKQLHSNDYRTIAFENYPHVCNRCGVELDILTADVHYKDRDRDNSSLDNLEILCKSCHHKEHIVRDTKTGKILRNR